jgi:hypothetical protein
MQDEIVLQNKGIRKLINSNNNPLGSILKVANESLFYFGIFLTAAFVLNAFGTVTDLDFTFTIGIKEVAVSTLGFFNVFFAKSFFKFFNYSN